jgi:LacI family gluconate utilization system Gnt-I transcriptional repressor
MVDVARLAGVSPMTVSRALRQEGASSVSAVARERVLKVVEELGYVHDPTAHMFSVKRSGFVAALIPSLSNSNFADTTRGITDALAESDLQLLLAYTDYSLEREEALVTAFLRRRPEGVILTGGAHTERTRELLKRADIPIIETWDLPAKPLDQVVGFSNARATEALVHYLAERAYKNISFIGGATQLDVRGAERRLGYSRAMQELGLSTGKVVNIGDPQHSMKQGVKAMAMILDNWPEVDAVICVSDLSAFGALMECKRRGIDVPKQMAIAGFGNFEVGRYSFPAITTVAVNCHQIGFKAGELLLAALKARQDGDPVTPEMIVVDYEIIPRATT